LLDEQGFQLQLLIVKLIKINSPTFTKSKRVFSSGISVNIIIVDAFRVEAGLVFKEEKITLKILFAAAKKTVI
jgi:hypothetical protein